MADNDEISLLDILVVLAENWIIIVSVTVGAALLAFGFVVLRPPAYTAEITVHLPEVEDRTSLAPIARVVYRQRDDMDAEIDGEDLRVTATASAAERATDLADALRQDIVDAVQADVAQREARQAEFFARTADMESMEIAAFLSREATPATGDTRTMRRWVVLASYQPVETDRRGLPPITGVTLASLVGLTVAVFIALLREALKNQRPNLMSAP